METSIADDLRLILLENHATRLNSTLAESSFEPTFTFPRIDWWWGPAGDGSCASRRCRASQFDRDPGYLVVVRCVGRWCGRSVALVWKTIASGDSVLAISRLPISRRVLAMLF